MCDGNPCIKNEYTSLALVFPKEWLAKREEESKKKNLENARIKKAEKEKQEKERRDKENEAIVTRRAWEETKKVMQ